MNFKKTRAIALAAVSALFLTACGSGGSGDGKSADSFVISTYSTSTSTYAEMASVSEAITRADGTKFRLIPSDTGVGRLKPLVDGTADFSRTGDEFYFAFEAMHEYASPQWGPQEVRVVWAPPTLIGFPTTAKTGIKKPEDLKGKKVPRYTANPSANAKIDFLLAAGGLDSSDVKRVDLAYGDQADALKSGQIDVMYMSVDSAAVAELASEADLVWLDYDIADQRGKEAIETYIPTVTEHDFEGRPGQKAGEKSDGLLTPLPIVAMKDKSEDSTYQMTKEIVENFDAYKGASKSNEFWSPEYSPVTPSVVPYAEGTIKYLKEKDFWTDEAQQKQDELLEREQKLAEGWEEVKDTPKDKLPGTWEKWKSDNL